MRCRRGGSLRVMPVKMQHLRDVNLRQSWHRAERRGESPILTIIRRREMREDGEVALPGADMPGVALDLLESVLITRNNFEIPKSIVRISKTEFDDGRFLIHGCLLHKGNHRRFAFRRLDNFGNIAMSDIIIIIDKGDIFPLSRSEKSIP